MKRFYDWKKTIELIVPVARGISPAGDSNMKVAQPRLDGEREW